MSLPLWGRQRELSTLPQGLVACEVFCIRKAHRTKLLRTEEYSTVASPWPGTQSWCVEDWGDLTWVLYGWSLQLRLHSFPIILFLFFHLFWNFPHLYLSKAFSSLSHPTGFTHSWLQHWVFQCLPVVCVFLPFLPHLQMPYLNV